MGPGSDETDTGFAARYGRGVRTSAFGFASAGLSMGADVVATGVAWPLGSLAATSVFLSILSTAGVEMGLAERLGAGGKGGKETPREEE